MSAVYATEDALLKDYRKLSQEYKDKVGKYIKDLRRIQRAESAIRGQLFTLEREAKEKSQKAPPDEWRCSFCGKPQSVAEKLIVAGNKDDGVCICDECARLCGEILDNEED